jgi:hypothetical protein
MSSLQKFHRRTQPFGPPPPPVIGSASPVAGGGFYLGRAGDGTSYMYVTPKSSEAQRAWGSSGTIRGTTSVTNGLANTNTLYAFGSAAHPAAYYCKSLTTGGYNTWYLPAKDELRTIYSNKGFTPFATSDYISSSNAYYWSSSEVNSNGVWGLNMTNGGGGYGGSKATGDYYVRAVRRV